MRTRLVIVARSSLTLVVMACIAAWGSRCRAQDAAERPDGQVSAASSSSPERLAEERELIRLLADTLEQVRANYVDSQVSERELIEAAIHGMIARLDPYSDYIAPQDLDQFRKGVEREFVGIGVQVSERDGQMQIISPLYGTPAWRGIAGWGSDPQDRGNQHSGTLPRRRH